MSIKYSCCRFSWLDLTQSQNKSCWETNWYSFIVFNQISNWHFLIINSDQLMGLRKRHNVELWNPLPILIKRWKNYHIYLPLHLNTLGQSDIGWLPPSNPVSRLLCKNDGPWWWISRACSCSSSLTSSHAHGPTCSPGISILPVRKISCLFLLYFFLNFELVCIQVINLLSSPLSLFTLVSQFMIHRNRLLLHIFPSFFFILLLLLYLYLPYFCQLNHTRRTTYKLHTSSLLPLIPLHNILL